MKKILGLTLMRRLIIKALTKMLSPLQTTLADEADLRFCYRLLLGRKPDKGGRRHWLREIRRGRSKDYLAGTFLTSQELINKQISEGQSRVELDDFVIYVDSRDLSIGDYILQNKTYEPHVTAAIKRALKDGQVFLDIGANIGWHTLTAATMLKDSGRVIAVEPNPRNVQLLYHSITANKLENVTVFQYAASDETKLLQLLSGTSNGIVRELPEDSAYCEYVQAVKLDDLIGSDTRVDAVKIDTDGHEPKVLRGMSGLIKKYHPIIFSEFCPAGLKELSNTEPIDYLRYLKNLGYSLSIIEHDASELHLNDESAIMEYWDNFKQTHDESYGNIDIIAR